MAQGYTVDSDWRDPDRFFKSREAIIEFPPLKGPMGSAPPTGWGRDLMDGPTAVGHLPRMSQTTALNRDQMTLERALRSSGDPQPNARRDDGGPLGAISRPQRGRGAR